MKLTELNQKSNQLKPELKDMSVEQLKSIVDRLKKADQLAKKMSKQYGWNI